MQQSNGIGSIPRSCRAAVLTDFNTPLSIREVSIPQNLEDGALLVRVDVASMCGTDVHLWKNELPGDFPLPFIPGHEMMGTIVRLADGAGMDSMGATVTEGDRIVWTHGSCGHCFYCTVAKEPSCCDNRRLYMQGSIDVYPHLTGGFAEYCYVFPESGRLKVPDAVKDAWASQASCALRTIVHAFDRAGRIESYQTVVVQGTGPLGLYAIAMASHAGSERIIAIGAPEARLELAKHFGATETISVEEIASARDRIRAIKHLTDGVGADVIFECSGAEEAFGEGVAMARKTGRYIVIGQIGGHWTSVQPGRIVHNQLDVRGTLSGHTEHYWKALKFLEATRSVFDWDALVTDEYTLDEINEAYQSMNSLATIKPVIMPHR